MQPWKNYGNMEIWKYGIEDMGWKIDMERVQRERESRVRCEGQEEEVGSAIKMGLFHVLTPFAFGPWNWRLRCLGGAWALCERCVGAVWARCGFWLGLGKTNVNASVSLSSGWHRVLSTK